MGARRASKVTNISIGMPGIRRLRTIALVALALDAVSATASAAEPDANRKSAAQLYDQAVAAYERGKYSEAARAFYEADTVAPSSDALSSALAAARLANDHLMVAQAAERAIARESSDAKLAGDARAALAEAEAHLARVELACQPAPCRVSIDGAEVPAGRIYVLPGTHVFAAQFAEAGHTEQRESLGAGSLYSMTLEAPRAPVAKEPHAAPPGQTSASASAHASDREASAQGRAKPFRPWVFYTGVGLTAALAGVTTWSGIDALSKVGHFKKTRTSADRELALDSEHRTDYLLAGTAVVTVLTAVVGLRFVDFGSEHHALVVAPARGGALVSWSGEL